MKIMFASAFALGLTGSIACAQNIPQTPYQAAPNSANPSPYGTLGNSSTFQRDDSNSVTGRSSSDSLPASSAAAPNNDAGSDTTTPDAGR
jgi:hypothetical protein